MQLSDYNDEFNAAGIKILAITYDSNADADKFHKQRKLPFPILSDKDSELIKQLGILNKGPQPGDRFYGIPYPGMFLVDSQGVILGKWAEQGYKDRPDPEDILDFVSEE